VGGLFQDVLELIALESNFRISYQKLENAYGVYNASMKQWNGLLGKVMRNETDVAIGEIAETVERSTVVDFSLPIISSYLNFYLKKENNARNLQWSMYYKVIFSSFIYFVYNNLLKNLIILLHLNKIKP
jgi:hypothetical protein